MKFEYKEIEGEYTPAGQDGYGRYDESTACVSVEELNACGAEGWELVAMDHFWKRAILKRQLL